MKEPKKKRPAENMLKRHIKRKETRGGGKTAEFCTGEKEAVDRTEGQTWREEETKQRHMRMRKQLKRAKSEEGRGGKKEQAKAKVVYAKEPETAHTHIQTRMKERKFM